MNTRISSKYLVMNKKLHEAPRGFGGSGWRWAGHVLNIIKDHNIQTMLDYGCGQSTLWLEMNSNFKIPKIIYSEYDPCIPSKDKLPSPAELVTCTDVLEHIEPEYLDAVLEHLASLTQKVLFINVAMHAANKRLPDGRNAHLIQKPRDWWLEQLDKYFRSEWVLNNIKVPKGREHKDCTFYLVK